MDFKALMKALTSMTKNVKMNQPDNHYMTTLADALGIIEKEGPSRINPQVLDYTKAVKPLHDFPYDQDKLMSGSFMYQTHPGRRLDMIDEWLQKANDVNGLYVRDNRTAYLRPEHAEVAPHELAHAAQDATVQMPKKYSDLRGFEPFNIDIREAYEKALNDLIYQRSSPSFANMFNSPGVMHENMADAAAIHFYHPDISQKTFPPEILNAVRTLYK